MNKRLLVLGACVGLVSSGCISTGMARTLDKGALQVSLGGGVQNVGSYASGESLPPHFVSLPQVDLGVRYGVTDRFDVGARLFLPGAAVEGRYALLRAPSLQSGIDLTLAPSLLYSHEGLGSTGGEPLLHAELPLLLGVNMGGSQLVLGARAGLLSNLEDPTRPGGRPDLTLGTSLGLAVPITPWLRVLPELSLRVQPELQYASPFIFNATLGVLFGGYKG